MSNFLKTAWVRPIRGRSTLRALAASNGARLAAFIPTQFFAFAANAAGITLKDYTEINSRILCPIAVAMFWVLIAISTIMILVAAYMYVTARGDPEKVSQAHKTITYAAIGIVVALVARTFPLIIGSIFSLGKSDISVC